MTTILVIEDELPIRELIAEMLMLEDFEVLQAGNGREGIEIAQSQCPNLIICDVMMPVLDGYGVLTALQQDTSTASIPFVFLTARGTKQDIRYGMNLGADDYLIKPFTQDELLDAISIRLRKQANSLQQYRSELESKQEQLDYLLYHDPLTQLPNQLSLQDKFQQIVVSVAPTIPSTPDEVTFPLILISLDRLHLINQLLGYEGGNELLCALVKEIQSFLQPQDIITYLNSNEFVILLVAERQTLNLETAHAQTTNFIQSLLQKLSTPLLIRHQEVVLHLLFGIAFYPHNGRTLAQLLQKATIAKESAKSQLSAPFQFYRPELTAVNDPLQLESDLRGALAKEQFVIYYQPQINTQSHRIIGAEALIRWIHPQRGLVSPGLFIPLAEETGLIQEIGEWILDHVCQQIKQWLDLDLSPVRIAVNLSARQFQQPNLAIWLANLLQKWGTDSSYLEVELTESMLVRDIPASIEQLQAIKSLGIRVAMDDFGTGYSSLSYLQQFPFDILKIDQCFIRKIDQNPKNAAIAQAIIMMAHQLNLRVIAEGVETPAELAFLQKNGCDDLQGYLFSPPVNAKIFTQMLQSKQSLFPTP
ncbi:MAG: EAL domain-containing protein [Woronichinia naegeliana WA131]|jgi:diguanylate cyclase (GGDEF)-like protein|uniref:EAL domain-containing protein n=1 Tax=Woronichinia naegeliana WA131 TaxID=2824559 RepID=A0A977L0N6_9CYAN|nr:MAG: EAL domain-containing protein [Woronichinia naegeliana WA131]